MGYGCILVYVMNHEAALTRRLTVKRKLNAMIFFVPRFIRGFVLYGELSVFAIGIPFLLCHKRYRPSCLPT